MSERYTYPDATLSLWQASVAEVHRQRASVQSRMALRTSNRFALVQRNVADDLMSPVHLIGAPLMAGKPVSVVLPPASPPIDGVSTLAEQAFAAVPFDCAKTAAQFLWAEMTDNRQRSQELAGELKCAECDAAGWSECLTTYLAYKASLGPLPYRPNTNIVIDLDKKTRLAVIGDWGTGDEVAINLLQQVATFKPEVLIHLGDVYYAGTHSEQENNFLDICQQVFGSGVPLFSLCGNHDMYSGGQGYYWLIDRIGQRSSYFCLQNSNWQFLAMDTGHNDNNPITVSSNMTGLVTIDKWSEATWHTAKIQQAGNRKTILLSHHQLFSPFGAVGKVNGQAYAYNPNLLSDFKDLLPSIAFWFWGHEHTLAVFDSYMDLKRGRCVGASAVPVFTDQQKYASAAGLQTFQGLPLPTWNSKAQLGTNGTDYNHAFAIMTLTGSSVDVDYYQVPILGTATKVLTESA